MGFRMEVRVDGKWSRNGQVWPDYESADAAGFDLLNRWFVPDAHRVVETDEPANYPTWTEHVAKNGLPAKSVSL